MLNRIIRMAAVACTLSILAGCTAKLDPAEEGAISFSAWSPLLRDDASTKATTESFVSNDDTFSVFGEKISAGTHTDVFIGTVVGHEYQEDGGIVVKDSWSYTPVKSWSWSSLSDYYDFVAVSPANIGTVKEDAVGNLSVTTHYDYDNTSEAAPAGGDKYDILGSTYRRSGSDQATRQDRVSFAFSHMGSAVAIKIINNSTSADVTLNYLQFQNLVVSADAKVSLDNYGSTVLRWANLMPSSKEVRRLSPGKTINHGNNWTSEFQIMIPQNLTYYEPKLLLNYTVAGTTTDPDVEIPLNGIERDDGTPITSWEIGVKYIYIISMRLDGGLLVTVTTTPWDSVEAETPGILI